MKDDRVYLLHIRDSIEKVLLYTTEGKNNFLSDSKTQDAVIRNFEIIGEAVKKVSDGLKTAHPDTAWKRIAGLRDKLIHYYFGVDLEIIWSVIELDLPDFRDKVVALLHELDTKP